MSLVAVTIFYLLSISAPDEYSNTRILIGIFTISSLYFLFKWVNNGMKLNLAESMLLSILVLGYIFTMLNYQSDYLYEMNKPIVIILGIMSILLIYIKIKLYIKSEC